MFQPRSNIIATSVALICLTGLAISSPAFAVAPTVSLTAPAANARYGAPAAITLTASAVNSGDTISKVEFYQGATLIGTVTSAPYTYNWSNVATGSYSLTAKATNSHNESKTSAAVAVVVNNAPTVSLTAPAANTSVAGKASITITANASDADGSISKVEFYNGATLLGSDTTAPYSYSWTNVAPGTYSITAKATDNLSGTTTSSPVSVTVTNPITVNLTAPANNASVTVGTPIAITATAADSKGSISKVEFYNGTTLLGSATASPYSYNWTNAAVGTYSLTAKVTDSQSLTQTSTAVSVQVKAAATTPPTVNLTPAVKQGTQTAPANGSFVAPAGISLTATATPASGSTISKVEFYQGATLIGTATAPTIANGNNYSVNWNNVTANSYSITAKATDNKNATATTAPVTVNVINNTPPTVSLTANPANATAPATIILNATAADSDGTITQVEFLNGTNSIATVTQAPYTSNWANVTQGNYSLTAKATDNLGATTTSAVVPVIVAAYQPKVYDVSNDQLGTPRVVTDSTGTEVWRWDSAPFGETLANEQPASQQTRFNFNMRFPGQYFDQETNLHYNYFRDYDPQAGRYVQSDPIGLRGGINTYAYVSGDPVTKVDPRGLQDGPGIRTYLRPDMLRQEEKEIEQSKQGKQCKCKKPEFGGYAQGGVGASGHFVMAGASASYSAAISTSGQICKIKTICVRIGPGMYAGAGGSVGAGAVMGDTDSLGGLSIGVGADIGFGVSVGGQATVGFNKDWSVSSAGGAKGKGGGGYGVNIGVDFCYSFPVCQECKE
ncbi:Ig-like domain-containing protein [Undibacterium sp. TS12]|uniref:Ig-like domain-containing protein n=1 Tax=Undibacterium sp. TS12 TaxID=2908202 RepID=UPI001F4CC89D|nr:Ig-like domain-containing protein [Undibacterium sp. TS12]MCH8622782.1 Ig-like domain-containing protein [Undibacterium sp. TS12]